MTIISLDNAGSLGLIRDVDPFELPPEAWTTLLNVKCTENSIQSMGADLTVYNSPVPPQTPLYFYFVYDPVNPYWVAASAGKIYKVVFGAHTDVSKLATTYSGGGSVKWQGLSFHNFQIMNNNSGTDQPQSLDKTASNFVDLPNWPATYFCRFLNAYKNFLIAYDITIAGVNHPNRIKWSEVAEPSALPTTWDHTDPNSLAGENDAVNVDGGTILCARLLGDLNFIYKDNAIWYMYPSNDLNVFKFRKFPEKQGILGTHAITTFKGRHFLAVNGDVVQHNGQGSLSSIIDKKNRKHLFNNINDQYYRNVQLLSDVKNNDIWVCYPDQDSAGELNRALIWNSMENTWTERELNDFNYVASGIVDTSGVSQLIDDDSGVIDLDTSLIDGITYNPSREDILGSNTQYYALDQDQSVLSGALIERSGFTLVGRDRAGSWKFSPYTTKKVTRIYPKMKGQGSFLISIGFSDSSDQAVEWAPAQLFTIGTDKHVDFWHGGVAYAIRIEPQDLFRWTYHGVDVDVHVVGENSI